MIENQYLEKLQDSLSKTKDVIRREYNKVIELSKENASLYYLSLQIDEVHESIMQLFFYKKQIHRLGTIDDKLPSTPEEITEHKHKRVISDIKLYEEHIALMDSIIKEIESAPKLYRLVSQLEMEKFRLNTSLASAKMELRIYEGEPDLTDGEIDIYITNSSNQLPFNGTIYLHGTSVEVGVIDYRGPVKDKWLGDIGYTIREEHRGNGFAYKALNLISQIIASKGIDHVTITTYKDNIPSVKTIERFGGVITGDDEYVLSYTCPIEPIPEITSTIKK